MNENIKIDGDTFEFDCKFNGGIFCLEVGPDKSAVVTSFDENGNGVSIPFSASEFEMLKNFINHLTE